MCPHLRHLKKRVSASSALRVCCNHHEASVWPHSGQTAFVVGSVFTSSPFSITLSFSLIFSLTLYSDLSFDNFYTLLKDNFSDLNEKELQLCCMMVAGFKTEEIAAIWMQSIFSVHKYKTNIRKKLKTPEGANIIAFLMSAPPFQWQFILLQSFFVIYPKYQIVIY